MLKLIKEAQQINEQVDLIVETFMLYNVPVKLMEDLGSVLNTWAREIKSGNTDGMYDFAGSAAQVLAFASLMRVITPPSDPQVADGIINLYKTANIQNKDDIENSIQDFVSRLSQSKDQKAVKAAGTFKQLAAAWGRSLTQVLQQPNPQASTQLAGKLLQAQQVLAQSMNSLQQAHGDAIYKNKMQGNQRMQSVLNNGSLRAQPAAASNSLDFT